MGKKLACICLAMLFSLMATACNPFTAQNIDDLLRAPVLGEEQGEIQKVLAAYQGEDLQYIYPKEGRTLTPFIQADLNGDGKEEAIVLYSYPSGGTLNSTQSNNVRVAVLEQQEEGWVLSNDTEGTWPDVASFEVADLLNNGTKQLIVGFASSNLSSKFLTVYRYEGSKLEPLYETAYSRYEIADFTGRGGEDLLMVSPTDQPGGMQLLYLPTRNGEFSDAESIPLTTKFTSCVGLYPSNLQQDDRRLVIVDGETEGSSMLSSQFVYYSGERFYTLSEEETLLLSETTRSPLLRARDIDGNRIVEIPVKVDSMDANIDAGEQDRKPEFIQWMDFTLMETGGEPQVKQFGLFDADRNVYIRFPDKWLGGITVSITPQNAGWVVRNSETNAKLLTLRAMEENEMVPDNAVQLTPSSDMYMVLERRLSNLERHTIQVVSLAT